MLSCFYSCATIPTPKPESPFCFIIQPNRYASIQRIAVVGGRLYPGENGTGISILKAFPGMLSNCNRFNAVSFREVLSKVYDSYIDLNLPFPEWHQSMEKSRAVEIGKKLAVDGVLVVWTVKEKETFNDFYIMAQLFCTKSGEAVASMETSKALREKMIAENKSFICDRLTTVSYKMIESEDRIETRKISFNRNDVLQKKVMQIITAMIKAS